MKILMAEDLHSVHDRMRAHTAEFEAVDLRFLEQDARLLMQTAAEWQPDVIIFDISMRGGMAIALLEALKKQRPELAVAISSLFSRSFYRKAFLSRGADLFFDKLTGWEGLVAFLRARAVPAASVPSNARQMALGGMVLPGHILQ